MHGSLAALAHLSAASAALPLVIAGVRALEWLAATAGSHSPPLLDLVVDSLPAGVLAAGFATPLAHAPTTRTVPLMSVVWIATFGAVALIQTSLPTPTSSPPTVAAHLPADMLVDVGDAHVMVHASNEGVDWALVVGTGDPALRLVDGSSVDFAGGEGLSAAASRGSLELPTGAVTVPLRSASLVSTAGRWGVFLDDVRDIRGALVPAPGGPGRSSLIPLARLAAVVLSLAAAGSVARIGRWRLTGVLLSLMAGRSVVVAVRVAFVDLNAELNAWFGVGAIATMGLLLMAIAAAGRVDRETVVGVGAR